MSNNSNPFDAITDGPSGGGSNAPLNSDEKLMATLSHLGSVIGGFILPLVIWLTQKDKSEYVAHHAKEALNFQITLIIGFIAGAILMIIFIGILVLAVVGIGGLILSIIAAIKANEGVRYEYPFNIRFIK